MKKTLNFGKIDWNGIGRKINLVTVEINLEETKNGPAFSACANVWNSKSSDIICGGQCLEELVPFFKDNKIFMTIFSMWEKYHLNDLHPGTQNQEKALEKADLWKYGVNYEDQCNYLKEIGLYNDNGVNFGETWVYWPIPEKDLETIKSLFLYGE